MEKGEAFRQNLEYELAKTKKDVLQEKKEREDCETEIRKLIDEFKSKVSKNLFGLWSRLETEAEHLLAL